MPARKWRPRIFRIFYSSTFTFVFLLILAHITVSPADAVYQAYKSRRIVDIFQIAAAYVLTGLVAIFIYASRLYTNWSVIKDIPKTYIPIEKDDLPGRSVRKMIAEGLARSAVIAYEARPRSKRMEDETALPSDRISTLTQSEVKQNAVEAEPTWGTIAHPGWSSPSSPDLPNLQYETIVVELPDLIEAKAVSLAPADPLLTPRLDGTAVPVERVVEVLQRPADMGLRQYVGQLAELRVIRDTVLANDFLAAYERARFSGVALREDEFRALMGMFAENLRGMTQLDSELLEELLDEDGDAGTEGEAYSSESSYSGTRGSFIQQRSDHDQPPPRVSEDSARSVTTYGPEDEGSPRSAPTMRSPSKHALQSRLSPSHHARGLRQRLSDLSIRSGRSSRSSGSVIHLADASEPLDLPYTIRIDAAP